MPRYFKFDEVKLPTNKRIRRIIVHYVRWVEIFGYIFCALVAAGVAVCWFYTVDELAVEKDAGTTVLKPYEYSIKTPKEAVVTQVMVNDFQKVKKGDPLVAIVDDPTFVAGWKSTQQLETMVKGLDDLIKANTPAESTSSASTAATSAPATAAATSTTPAAPVPPPPGLELAVKARDEAQARITAWRTANLSRVRPQVLTAPAKGEVLGAKDLQGKVIAADGEVLRVADYSTVRMKIKLAGTNVERVRVGQTAKIQIQPGYGTELAVHGDVRLNLLQRQRLRFQDILDVDDTKKLLTDHWKGKYITSKEDRKWRMALPVTEASDVELVTTRFQFQRLRGAPAAEKRVMPEPLEKMKLEGQVIEGSHTATYRLSEKDPKVREAVRKQIDQKLRGKEILTLFANPLQAMVAKARKHEFEGEEVGIRVRGFGEPSVFFKVKAALPEPKREEQGFLAKQKKWEEDVKKNLEKAVETERTERFYEGVVELKNAPRVLQDTMRALAQRETPTDLKAKVTVVVGKRRLALVLFRQ